MNPRNLLAAALLAIPAAMAGPARAGDIAELQVLGFNADASIFAFEEFGIQEGSGFPYSRRYYIDVETDRFLPGTPIRVRIDDEGASLAEARDKARAAGQGVVSDAELAANAGHAVAFNPVTELSSDPFRIVANPRPVLPPVDAPLEFRLEEIELPASADCAAFGPARGYRLLRVDGSEGGTTLLLHEDAALPRGRGCANGYRLSGIRTIFPENGKPSYVVLIQVRSVGFEGPNYGWIAVPGRL